MKLTQREAQVVQRQARESFWIGIVIGFMAGTVVMGFAVHFFNK